MRTLRCLVPLVVVLAIPVLVQAAPRSWVGKTVITKSNITPTQEPGNGAAVVNSDSISYEVVAEKGDYIRVRTYDGPEGWFFKGDTVLADEAVAFFSKRLDEDPTDTGLLNRRAVTFEALKFYDYAILDYTEAIRLHPKESAFLNNRANALLSKKEYDKAIDDYSAAITLEPLSAITYFNRGRAWIDKKDYDRALADYAMALTLDPKYAPAVDGRGSAWDGKKDYGKALEDFAEAFRMEPSYLGAREHWAWLAATCPDVRHRNGQKALDLARKNCELNRWHSTLYLETLAAAYAETGRFEAAIYYQVMVLDDEQFTKDSRGTVELRLELYSQGLPYRQGMEDQTVVAKVDPATK